MLTPVPIRIAGLLLALALASCGADGTTEQPCNCPQPSDGGASGCGQDAALAEAGWDGMPEVGEGSAPDAMESAAPEAGAGQLRLMTFNIKHGELSSLEAIAEVILAEQADIVGLQEVDVDAERSGKVNQPHRLGQLTGMANLFRSALTLSDGGLYGLAVLSRFPIVISDKVQLTSGSEQRILALIELDVNGTTVPFCITHLGLTASERATQATELVAALAGKPRAVLVGDMNASPTEGSMQTLAGALTDTWVTAGQGDGFTIPSGTPNRRIDYIWLGPAWAPAIEAHVPVTQASDHRPVVLTVPAP